MPIRPEDLADPDHPAVRQAIEHRCAICGAEPQSSCRDLVEGNPLRDRIIHQYRIPKPMRHD